MSASTTFLGDSGQSVPMVSLVLPWVPPVFNSSGSDNEVLRLKSPEAFPASVKFVATSAGKSMGE